MGEDWYRDAVSNQSNFVNSVSLCFKSVRGCAEGKHRGTETQRGKGWGEQGIEWVGEDWYRDAVSNQSNFVPSVSLCFKSVRGCAERETQRHRDTEGGGDGVSRE